MAGIADFALRIGSTAILARVIAPEQFGLVMMITAVTSIADQFRDLGLSTATVQRSEIDHQSTSNLFWINVGIGLAIALVICAGSPLIVAYYHEPRLLVPACLLSANFLWGGLMVQHQALLTRQLKLGFTATVRFFSSLLSTALAIVLALKGYGYWALVWREFARCALLTIGIWALLPWLPSLPSRRTNVLGMVKFGADLSLANIMASISGASDRFLLGRFSGSAPMAMYRQAYQLLMAPTDQLLSPIYQVTEPGLSMLQTDAARFRKFYGRVLTMACLVTMPLSLFVAVYSSEITRVLLGPRWAASAPLLMILSLSTFIKQPVGSTAFVLIAQGRSRTYLRLSLLQNLAAILFMAIGVPWGTIGVAVADVVTTYLAIPPRLHYTFKDSPFSVRLFLSTIARPVVASISMALTLVLEKQYLHESGALAILVSGGATAAVTFIGVWLMLPGGAAELRQLILDLRAALQKRIGSSTTVPSRELVNQRAAS